MSEIDIEEHDLLHHPYITEIFSDVKWIKDEIYDTDNNEYPKCENVGSSDVGASNHSEDEALESNDAVIAQNDNSEFSENEYLEENIIIEAEEEHEHSDSFNSNYNSVQSDSLLSRNKIIVGSKIPRETLTKNVLENFLLQTNFQNKINFASTSRIPKDPLSAVVMLKDCGYILRNHPSYCHECSTIFPSTLDFDAHNASEHSLLLPLRSIRHIETNNFDSYNTQGKLIVCPICAKFFRSHCLYLTHIRNKHNTSNLQPLCKEFNGKCFLCSVKGLPNLPCLYQHIDSFHSDAYSSDSSESTVAGAIRSTARKSTSNKTQGNTNNVHRKRTFKQNVALTSEFKQEEPATDTALKNKSQQEVQLRNEAVQGTSKYDVPLRNKAVKSTSKQGVPVTNTALKNTSQKEVQLRNEAVQGTSEHDVPLRNKAVKSTSKQGPIANTAPQSTTKQSTDSVDELENASTVTPVEKTYLKCPICRVFYRLKAHYVNHCNMSHEGTYVPPTRVPFSGICECGYRDSIVKSFNAHLKIRCRFGVTEAASDNSFEAYDYDRIEMSDDADSEEELVLIAKDTVFKCPACDLHFMSCKAAYYHSLHRSCSRPQVPCDECARPFRRQDIRSHTLQHQLMATINVIETTKKAYHDLVLVCNACEVGVDAHSISVGHAARCPTTDSTLCRDCNVTIANICRSRHAKAHANNATPVVVKYLCGTVAAVKEMARVGENVLYYCRVCKCYDPVKQPDYHKYGNCIQNKIRICRFCGLGFSDENHSKHILEHQKNRFRSMDMKLVDLQTNEVMQPLIADCDEDSAAIKRNRERHKEETVYCSLCHENYDTSAYDIHLQYHERPSITSEIMQKYLTMQSLWNIVYVCRSCGTAFDGYDLAVEHSQDHLAGSAGPQRALCRTCDLTFDAASSARHANLHNGAAINRDSFCILSFDYERLLSTSWDDVFKPISGEQKSHVLSKSVYNGRRGIRLELLFDGPPTHTLYKCALCTAIVDESRLLVHAYNKNACVYEQLLNCPKCDLAFETPRALEDHKSNHLPTNEMRIILFNRRNHFSLNVALIKLFDGLNVNRNEQSTTSVVFYKCVVCRAGIHLLQNIHKHRCWSMTSNYIKCLKCELMYRAPRMKAHQAIHMSTEKYYVAPFKNGELITEKQNGTYTLYKCGKCNICTYKKLNICVSKHAQLACKSCGLRFMKRDYAFHECLHRESPNLSREHFNIIHYKPISDKGDSKKPSQQPSNKIIVKLPMKHISCKPASDINIRCLYKCTCSLLFVKWRTLKIHLRSSCSVSESKMCKCGISFHRSSIKEHLALHTNCTSIKKYLVATVNLDEAGFEESRKKWLWMCTVCDTHYKSKKRLNCHLKGNTPGPTQNCQYCSIKLSAGSFYDHMELHRANNYAPLQLNKLLLSVSHVEALKKQRATLKLYRCKECNVHFPNHIQFESHMSENIHDVQRALCNQCDYFFPSTHIRYHKRQHHYRHKYTRDDFTIVDENIETETTKPAAKICDSSPPVKNLKASNEPAIATIEPQSNRAEEDLQTVFQCGICNLNYMNLKTLQCHIITHGAHTKKKAVPNYECSFCGLLFSCRSIDRHLSLHHGTVNLQSQDLIVAIYSDVNTYTVKRIKPLTKTRKRKMPRKVKPAKKRKSSPKVIPGSFKESPASKEIIETPKKSLKIQPNSTASSVVPESSPHLFKCALCNVYFTSYDLCYDHTLDHRTLDQTEYIGCKICRLQLVCECLGIHMKGHREGTFRIEEVVVKEFQPTGGAPSITTYLARDLNETNVISTTTNFG